jgi:hypothetical protein
MALPDRTTIRPLFAGIPVRESTLTHGMDRA